MATGIYYAYYTGSWALWGMYQFSHWWAEAYKFGHEFLEKQAKKEKQKLSDKKRKSRLIRVD